jgi:hypothetical protein
VYGADLLEKNRRGLTGPKFDAINLL